MATQLHDLGLLTTVDLNAFAMYCETVSVWVEATKALARTGLVGKTTNGNLIHNPYLSIANRAKRDALRFMQEFGLTPSSRSRISVSDGGGRAEKDLADLLFEGVNG